MRGHSRGVPGGQRPGRIACRRRAVGGPVVRGSLAAHSADGSPGTASGTWDKGVQGGFLGNERLLRTWAALPRLAAGGPVRPGQAAPRSACPGPRRTGPPLVAGDVPDRPRLLLHPRLPARHRRPRGRTALPGGDRRPRRRHPLRRPARLPPGGPGEPARRRLDRDAGTPAVVLEGQAVRPRPARLRGHRLHDHHHPVGCRRHRPPGREPSPAQRPDRQTGHHHPGDDRPARRRLPQGLQRGDRPGCRPGRDLPRAQRGRRRHRLLPCLQLPRSGERLGGRAHRGARQRRRHDRRRPGDLPQTRPRPLRLRDRRRRHAAHRG